MADVTAKSGAQRQGEASIDAFRQELGPFVLSAQTPRMPIPEAGFRGDCDRKSEIEGFGSGVIKCVLAHEFGGHDLGSKVTPEYPSHGVACTIDIPLPAQADA
jgi:hypothetical protein